MRQVMKHSITMKAREVKRKPMTSLMYGPWLITSHRPWQKVRGCDFFCPLSIIQHGGEEDKDKTAEGLCCEEFNTDKKKQRSGMRLIRIFFERHLASARMWPPHSDIFFGLGQIFPKDNWYKLDKVLVLQDANKSQISAIKSWIKS